MQCDYGNKRSEGEEGRKKMGCSLERFSQGQLHRTYSFNGVGVGLNPSFCSLFSFFGLVMVKESRDPRLCWTTERVPMERDMVGPQRFQVGERRVIVTTPFV